MSRGGQMIREKGTGNVFRIVARSELDPAYALAFEGMEMETKDGVTILTGRSRTNRTCSASSPA